VEETATLALQKKLISAMEDAKRSQAEIRPIPFKSKIEEKLKIENVDGQAG
jgi:hypothetical protein